jgi:hypothetical protein
MIRELAAVVATHVQDSLILIEPENYDSELAARVTRITATKALDHPGLWQRLRARVLAMFKL